MKLRRPIVFGNWKMNGLRDDGLALARAVLAGASGIGHGCLGIFPPATLLAGIAEAARASGVLVGAQDCHEALAGKGAFTGSLSAAMLKDAGAEAVLLGHSERRHGLCESDALVRGKVEAALAAGLLPVVCVGETEAEYLAGERDRRLETQVEGSLPKNAPPELLVIAYEPVWAIGTGRTPSAAEILDTHAALRQMLARRWQAGASIPILYGGSVKKENAAEILALPGVDGALVGGASLDAAGFLAILAAGAGGGRG